MAIVSEERELEEPPQGGWAVEYTIRRDDGREVVITAIALADADADARDGEDSELAVFVAERGRSLALAHAEEMRDDQHRTRLALYDARFGVMVETDTPKGGG